jgi:hypothetical protein
LQAAATLIRNGVGAELFRAFVDEEKAATGDGDDVVPRLMRHLERITPKCPAVGAYLMGRLYGSAWRTPDHNVYDGIGLWMDHLSSAEAADALAQLSNEPIRPALEKMCSSWAKRIREKSK